MSPRPKADTFDEMQMPLDATPELSDDVLLIRFANGDRAAARTLTLRLTPRVLAQATRMLGNRAEAEDVAQEAMLRLWKIAPDWRQGEAQVSTWLYRVAANLCIDRLRRKPPAPIEDVPEPADDAPNAEGQMQTRERLSALDGALARLPERQRQAVILRHLENLGNPEIAEIMDISVEAVESLTARGKRQLAQILAPRREELGFEDD